MNFMTNNSGLGKIILIVIIATIIVLTLLFSMVYEALFSVKFRKCYFDNDVNTINLNLTFFKLFMLAVSLSFIMFALYSLANTIYSEISENVTKEIVRSSKFNMFGSAGSAGSATEILNNNVKQVNVNIQCDSGSAIVEEGGATTLPHRLVNKMYQENTNTQTGAKDNIAMQKNVNTQQASSSKSPVPNNSSQTTLITNDNLGTNSSTPLSSVFSNMKQIFHNNISRNSVSTDGGVAPTAGGLNTIELTEFRNKINSLLDELKALPNHDSAVYTFTKIVQSTEVTDKHSSTLLLNHLTDTVKAFTVIPNTDMSTEGGATASPLDELAGSVGLSHHHNVLSKAALDIIKGS